MRRLTETPELLDGALDEPRSAEEVEGNLRDLRRVNRSLWGTRLSLRALDALVAGGAGGTAEPAGRPLAVVDVGTGAADIPSAMVAHGRLVGRPIRVTAVESRREILDAALRIDPGLDRGAGVTLAVADGRHLPFDDAAFDVAHASLVVHHLEPAEAVRLLAEMRRVARIGVVVNDLLRSRRAFVAARALATIGTRNRMTRNDGPLSVRRAYTEPELRALLDLADLAVVARATDPFRHRVALAAVRAEPR